MKRENQIESSQEARALDKNQKHLSVQILVFFFFCSLLLLERVFYQIIVKNELIMLSNFQLNIGLTKIVTNKIQPSFIQSGFFTFFSFFSNSKIQFLLLTHIFISAYVSIQTHLVAKVMNMTMAVIFTVSLIQIIYKGARPFWVSDSVLASICQNNFTHPSLGLITMVFVPFYFYYCLKTRQIDVQQSKICKKTILNFIGIFLTTFIVQFINYALGMIFIINIALSTVFLLIFILVITSFNSILNKGIKKLLFIKSKQNQEFKWIFGILFLQAFLLMVYYDSNRFLNIQWIKNFTSCTKYLNYKQETIHYNQTLGTWLTLIQTAPVFGWVSAIFGIRYCNFNILATQWFQGTTKQKIVRLIIANIFLIPSWMFILFVEPGEWIKEAGLNQFIVDSFHYFLLYLWLFGFMPVLVLEKLLHLTPMKYDGQYILLLERQ